MNDSSHADGAGALGSDTAVYLERDIFFNLRLGQLESPAGTLALNFRECILLRLLLGERVRKQAVIDAAWGDNGVVVTDASYHQLVRSLRKKFEEIGLSGQSIKTLPRFGLEYLRDTPAVDHASKEAPISIEISQAKMPVSAPSQEAAVSLEEEKTAEENYVAEAGSAARCRSGKQRMKWSLRLLLWILPFFIGLMIGHLGYRGGNSIAGLPVFKTLRAPPVSSSANGPMRRSQCT